MSDGVHDSVQWLEWLYGQKPPGLIWIGGHGDGWKGRLFATAGEAGEYARWLDDLAAGGVYFRLTPVKPLDLWVPRTDGQGNVLPRGRGVAEDSSHLVAFGADLDLAGPGHKATKLPRPATDDGLLRIMEAAGVPAPTAWINSGGGRYAFWRFDEPLPLDTPEKLASAQERSAALHARIIAEAAAAGFKIDNTRDLARVYRLPGTHNRKGETPFVATVITSSGPQYSIGAFSTLSSSSSAPPSSSSASPAPVTESDHGASSSAASWEREAIAGGTALFGGGAGAGTARGDAPRSFTLAQAREFVTPFLVALREAKDGEINVRLNEAAIAMAHFGDEFWPADTADAVLYDNLSHTVYDGATWQAEHTIASARRGAGWHAVLLPDDAAGWVSDVPPAPDDLVDKMMAKMLDRDQLVALPEPLPLVAGVLDMDSESWIIGASGGFKSFVALDIACHVGVGAPWRDRQVTQGEVIYIVAEGAKGIRKRVQAWEKTYERRMENVLILPEPVQVAPAGFKGGIGQDWITLIEIVRRRRPVLVVVDTQARVTAGLKENDNAEMGLFINAVTHLKQAAGSCVLVVHHTGRDGGDARGASAIDAAQDTELKVVRPTGKARGELTAEIRMDKQKDDDDRGVIKFGMQVVDVGMSVHTGKRLTSLALIPFNVWREQQIEHAPLPDWKRDLASSHREVLRVMDEHSDEYGLTLTEVLTFVGERRKQDGTLDKMPKSTCASALNALVALNKTGAEGGIMRVGSRYVLKSKFDTE